MEQNQDQPNQSEVQLDDGLNPQPLPEQFLAPEQQTETEYSTYSACNNYTREEFITGFREAFGFASDFSGIKSLAVDMENSREALGSERAASRLYDASLKYRWLSFLTNKNTGWLADAVIIGSFVAGKAGAVAKEVGQPSLKELFLGKFKWLKRKKTGEQAKQSGSESLAQAEPVKATAEESLSAA